MVRGWTGEKGLLGKLRRPPIRHLRACYLATLSAATSIRRHVDPHLRHRFSVVITSIPTSNASICCPRIDQRQGGRGELALLGERFFHTIESDFRVRVGGPHATKGLRKLRFLRAGGAPAREN